MNEKKLLKYLRKEFKGQEISLKKLSQILNDDFDTTSTTAGNLALKGIIETKEIREIGRQNPIDIKIINFYPPKKESILKHPLLIYVVYPLLVIFIAWLATQIWTALRPKKSEGSKINQTSKGNDTSQMATTGNDSPITNIKEQNIYQRVNNSSFYPTLETIHQLGNLSLWTNAGGNRQSYQTLLSWEKDKAIDSNLKAHITSEIKKIWENYYLYPIIRAIDNENGRWIEWGWICKVKGDPKEKVCARGIEPPEGFDAANVLAHLYKTNPETPWQEHARAACILRNIKTAYNKGDLKDSRGKEKFFGRLIALMSENERSLCVSKMAFETFRVLTEFTPESNDPFAFQEAIDHWNDPENRKAILEKNI